MTNIRYAENILVNCDINMLFANFTSTKSRISLQVGRKIAPCEKTFIHLKFLELKLN